MLPAVTPSINVVSSDSDKDYQQEAGATGVSRQVYAQRNRCPKRNLPPSQCGTSEVELAHFSSSSCVSVLNY